MKVEILKNKQLELPLSSQTSEGLVLCVDGVPVPGQLSTSLETLPGEVPTFTVRFCVAENVLKIRDNG